MADPRNPDNGDPRDTDRPPRRRRRKPPQETQGSADAKVIVAPVKTDPLFEFKSLLWVVLGASLLFALILWPFFGAVCWSIFIAITFWPLHARLLARWPRQPTLVALLSLLGILVVVILPLGLVAASVVTEGAALAERLRAGSVQPAQYFQQAVNFLPDWVRSLLDRFGLGDLALLQQKVIASLAQSGQALTARVLTIGQNALDFIVSFFVMLYILFFLLRDGISLTASVERAIPLRRDDTQRLLTQFATVVRATVKGNVVVALVQGMLGGLAFWALGVPGPLLWGGVMALLSLLPAVGAALVWAPVAIYFLATGAIIQAVALTLWGVLAIGLVDNVLRPILVGKDTRMPDYLILIATLGGLAIFGLNGFVIGPVIAAMFLVSWDILARARARAEGGNDEKQQPDQETM
ncbi:AI-2E family transporter [Variovorax sp. VNK109]|jgi:predicted PurR-regulated permease PerM|uniref:AI-2E family transporter n=1 Tax=Variovorax sp. VNK109 TaxID=3400919 RepID=UPI003C11DA32